MPTLAEWAGFVISTVGFGITIWQIIEAKRAAMRAQTAADKALDAARETRAAILRASTLDTLLRAIDRLEEIKRMQASASWDLALDRCSQGLLDLVLFEAMYPQLSRAHRKKLGHVIQEIQAHEELLTKQRQVEVNGERTASLNRTISHFIVALTAVHSELRKEP